MIKDKKITYCNQKGDICIAKLNLKEETQEKNLEEFLSKLYDQNLELSQSQLDLEINSLILTFKNFDYEKIITIYEQSKYQNNTTITQIILEYFDNFIEFKKQIFCSAKECEAIITITKLPIITTKESIVLKKILTTQKNIIIDDLIKYQKNKPIPQII